MKEWTPKTVTALKQVPASLGEKRIHGDGITSDSAARLNEDARFYAPYKVDAKLAAAVDANPNGRAKIRQIRAMYERGALAQVIFDDPSLEVVGAENPILLSETMRIISIDPIDRAALHRVADQRESAMVSQFAQSGFGVVVTSMGAAHD